QAGSEGVRSGQARGPPGSFPATHSRDTNQGNELFCRKPLRPLGSGQFVSLTPGTPPRAGNDVPAARWPRDEALLPEPVHGLPGASAQYTHAPRDRPPRFAFRAPDETLPLGRTGHRATGAHPIPVAGANGAVGISCL